MEPNKENLRKWVAALRSGEFEQGKRSLYYEEEDGTAKYCCLGVACEIAEREGVNVDPGPCDDGCCTNRDWRTMSYLSEPAQMWLGVGEMDPVLVDSGLPVKYEASYLNDQKGKTFNEIADLIETRFNLREETD